jgi:chemotaxis signal transduction protein
VSAAAPEIRERLLTFEVGGAVYALPIAGVLEVAEVGSIACIPTLAPSLAGVVNHHGDALPLIDRARLLDLPVGALPPPQHILVVYAPPDGARLGLPVDRVLGLVDGLAGQAAGSGPVAERRSCEGRVVNILEPERLVARARHVVENASASAG